MAIHIARVELLNVPTHQSESAYDTLYQRMKSVGFDKTINDYTTGVRYHLPPAEYYHSDTTKTNLGIRDLAVSAASQTGHSFRVLVTTGDICWQNLDKV